MGYGGGGGTSSGTLNVDIVQTDVNAIVNGLTGIDGRTLTNLYTQLGEVTSHLYHYPSYRPAADILASIESVLSGIRSQTDRLIFDEYGRLIVTF